MADSQARPKRILAVDFGDRRTGLAATDFTGAIVSPLPALVGLGDEDCATAIAALVVDRDSQVVVVGMPIDTAGKLGKRAQRTLGFVERLTKLVRCPVTTHDERNSTDEAHEILRDAGMKAAKRKKLTDSLAALVILRRFQDEH